MANREYWLFGRRNIYRWLTREEGEACPHVDAEVGIHNQEAMAYAVGCEDDSCGPVCGNVVCRACFDEAEAASRLELENCVDCKSLVAREKGSFWKWYDFYVPQGDEPLFICQECWDKPKHQLRRQRDEEEEAHERAFWPEDDEY